MATGTLIALTAVGAGLSAVQASEQNRAIRKQNKAQRNATAAEARTAELAADEEREKAARRVAAYHGTLRASSAARSASGASLETSAFAQLAEAGSDINTQLMNNLLGIETAGAARINRNQTNPFVTGLSGGISGLSTGLSIVQGVNNLEGA